MLWASAELSSTLAESSSLAAEGRNIAIDISGKGFGGVGGIRKLRRRQDVDT